ncbi:MAG: YfiR family protein [bacterium]|nr:YfiR family protein [bacterium]
MTNKNTKISQTTRKQSAEFAGKSLQVFILVMLILIQAPSLASEDESETRDLIRAAMVFNFCKFVDWPRDNQPNELVLGVMGSHIAQPDFSSINGKTVRDLPVLVKVVNSESDLAQCNLVFIADVPQQRMLDAFATSRNESILTISETEDFCTQGGIIQMVPRRGKMRFFINRDAANEAGLTMSSQLLKMARIVEGN